MSKFFRSGNSNSSSESDQASDSELEVDDASTEDLSHLNRSPLADGDTNAVDRPLPDWSNNHRDFLLHALLEERCMSEVLSSYSNHPSGPRPSRDSPEIQAEAVARYQRLCAQLASYNLISTGLEADQHAITRQRYRDGLDMLSQQRTSSRVPQSLRRLLTDTDTEVALLGKRKDEDFAVSRGDGPLNRPALLFPPRRLLTDAEAVQSDASLQMEAAFRNTLGLRNATVPHSILESRYHHEFEELSTLGRGGYGIVYHVRHRLDNQTYAVKKVPLSTARLQRIQRRAQPELEEVLRELRTLARLDHPNIVRYFGGWIEWVDGISPPALVQSNGESQGFSQDSGDAYPGAEDFRPDTVRRIVPESSMEEPDVVFETSGATSAEAACDISTPDTDSINSSGFQLRGVGTRITVATVSDDTVESLRRHVDPSISSQSAASGAHFSEPSLALHMQMSLHPMTLADFLAPLATSESGPEKAPALTHCYHLEPSIGILLAVLDGVEYLHGEGIVHRDIKPANIFLGPHSNPRSTSGSVDLLLCSDCRAQRNANPIRLEVRIGDFGLVSVADPEDETSADSDAVGTEIYGPLTARARIPSLDLYALGIIAFELLWRFDTRMERLHTLQRLKEGAFPAEFAGWIGSKRTGSVKQCIEAMLSYDEDGTSIHELRKRLHAMQSVHEDTIHN